MLLSILLFFKDYLIIFIILIKNKLIHYIFSKYLLSRTIHKIKILLNNCKLTRNFAC